MLMMWLMRCVTKSVIVAARSMRRSFPSATWRFNRLAACRFFPSTTWPTRTQQGDLTAKLLMEKTYASSERPQLHSLSRLYFNAFMHTYHTYLPYILTIHTYHTYLPYIHTIWMGFPSICMYGMYVWLVCMVSMYGKYA